jgi:hypothetical protein
MYFLDSMGLQLHQILKARCCQVERSIMELIRSSSIVRRVANKLRNKGDGVCMTNAAPAVQFSEHTGREGRDKRQTFPVFRQNKGVRALHM